VTERMNALDTITLCTFQPRAVYEEIMRNGQYRLTREDFVKYKEKEQVYKPHRIPEKYERLMKKSNLSFHPDTMPIWGWYKDEFITGFQKVSPPLFEGVFERARKNRHGDGKEMVGLFVEMPKHEVFLTNFEHWDHFLYIERHDDDVEHFEQWTQEQQGWYLADVAEEDYYFSRLAEIEGDVKVQGIFPEIRKDRIVEIIEESR
jgi:hypothetical protein